MTCNAAIPRVHRINRPLVVGEEVMVPCIVGNGEIVPVLWPPHRDELDRQPERHFHVDHRFRAERSVLGLRPVLGEHTSLKWHRMRVLSSNPNGDATPVGFIHNAIAALPCNAMLKGKCPHKDFNLAQVEADANGVITCPMHGMRFSKFTGKGIPIRRSEMEQKPAYSEEELWLRG